MPWTRTTTGKSLAITCLQNVTFVVDETNILNWSVTIKASVRENDCFTVSRANLSDCCVFRFHRLMALTKVESSFST